MDTPLKQYMQTLDAITSKVRMTRSENYTIGFLKGIIDCLITDMTDEDKKKQLDFLNMMVDYTVKADALPDEEEGE